MTEERQPIPRMGPRVTVEDVDAKGTRLSGAPDFAQQIPKREPLSGQARRAADVADFHAGLGLGGDQVSLGEAAERAIKGIAPDPVTGLGDMRIYDRIMERVNEHQTIVEGRSVGDATDALIAERGKVHGDFTDHARATQTLKTVVRLEMARREQRDQPSLTPVMVEALEMIAHKMGRILAGDADFKDHWRDIQGYARLVEERCTKG